MKKKLDLSKQWQQADKTPVRNLRYESTIGAWPLRGQAYVNGTWVDRCWYPDGSHMKESKRLIPLVETPEFDPSLTYISTTGEKVKIYEVDNGRIYYRDGAGAFDIAVSDWQREFYVEQQIKIDSLCIGTSKDIAYIGWYKEFDYELKMHILRTSSLGLLIASVDKVRPVTHEDLDKWNA